MTPSETLRDWTKVQLPLLPPKLSARTMVAIQALKSPVAVLVACMAVTVVAIVDVAGVLVKFVGLGLELGLELGAELGVEFGTRLRVGLGLELEIGFEADIAVGAEFEVGDVVDAGLKMVDLGAGLEFEN